MTRAEGPEYRPAPRLERLPLISTTNNPLHPLDPLDSAELAIEDQPRWLVGPSRRRQLDGALSELGTDAVSSALDPARVLRPRA